MNFLTHNPQEILYPNGKLMTSQAYQLPGRRTNWNDIPYDDEGKEPASGSMQPITLAATGTLPAMSTFKKAHRKQYRFASI